MDIIQNLYNKTLQENERNLKFWEDYLNNLKALDFSAYSDKLKVPILVPIGSRILFKGEMKHTNEVTVALGADYFTKCSIAQAEILRLHRIKGAQAKVDIYKKERDYLQNQFSFSKEKVFQDDGKDIIEHFTPEEDEVWRRKHRENVRKYKQSKVKDADTTEVNDDELWNRLEELELQEELENEIGDSTEENKENKAIAPNDFIEKPITETNVDKDRESKEDNIKILEKVLNKQQELEQKILDLRSRERSKTKTEADLMSRLDEMEILDELEDEMDRVDDIIENENGDENEVDNNDRDVEPIHAPAIKRSVSFADDEDEPEVLELHFKHSEIQPDTKEYDPNIGISKPSDIYEAYKSLFNVPATSILKKSSKLKHKKVTFIEEKSNYESVSNLMEDLEDVGEISERTIVIKDVIEKHAPCISNVEISARPTSLFKKNRQQRK